MNTALSDKGWPNIAAHGGIRNRPCQFDYRERHAKVFFIHDNPELNIFLLIRFKKMKYLDS